MALFPSSYNWRPRWIYAGEPHAVVVFTTETELGGAASSLYGDRVRLLAAKFLQAQLERASDVDLLSDASFLYVLFGREPEAEGESLEVGAGTAVVEYGFGESPAAPDEWCSVSLKTLLVHAIEWLRSDTAT